MDSSWPLVYVALGGNIGDTLAVFQQVLDWLAQLKGVQDLQVSRFYRTSPVSGVPQDPYLNGVCSFKTSLSPKQLFHVLQKFEAKLGKKNKPKEAPRIIDLDLLFYGTKRFQDATLEIPHPRWLHRLFVLVPLRELTEEVWIEDENQILQKIDLDTHLQHFQNTANEAVYVYS